jgi:hypothetical protein
MQGPLAGLALLVVLVSGCGDWLPCGPTVDSAPSREIYWTQSDLGRWVMEHVQPSQYGEQVPAFTSGARLVGVSFWDPEIPAAVPLENGSRHLTHYGLSMSLADPWTTQPRFSLRVALPDNASFDRASLLVHVVGFLQNVTSEDVHGLAEELVQVVQAQVNRSSPMRIGGSATTLLTRPISDALLIEYIGRDGRWQSDWRMPRIDLDFPHLNGGVQVKGSGEAKAHLWGSHSEIPPRRPLIDAIDQAFQAKGLPPADLEGAVEHASC